MGSSTHQKQTCFLCLFSFLLQLLLKLQFCFGVSPVPRVSSLLLLWCVLLLLPPPLALFLLSWCLPLFLKLAFTEVPETPLIGLALQGVDMSCALLSHLEPSGTSWNQQALTGISWNQLVPAASVIGQSHSSPTETTL